MVKNNIKRNIPNAVTLHAYDLTQKGRVLMDMLLETPLPVERYVDPRQ